MNKDKEKEDGELNEKLIKPGEHIFIPGPENRIGPNGEKGYVHDPTFLVKNPPAFWIPDDEHKEICLPPGEGCESLEGAKNLQNICHHMPRRIFYYQVIYLTC